MFGWSFFAGVVGRAYFDQWLGDLFFRGSTPSEIEAMPWHRLKYWGGWCEKMTQAEIKAYESAKSKPKRRG